MLDSFLAFRETAYPDDHIWWGAYVGTADEILILAGASPTLPIR